MIKGAVPSENDDKNDTEEDLNFGVDYFNFSEFSKYLPVLRQDVDTLRVLKKDVDLASSINPAIVFSKLNASNKPESWLDFLKLSKADIVDIKNGKVQNVINKTDEFHHYRIYALAVCSGHLDFINNLDESDTVFTIEMASRFGCKVAIEPLLKALPPCSGTSKRMSLAFLWAGENDHFDIAEMLLRARPGSISSDKINQVLQFALSKEASHLVELIMKTPDASQFKKSRMT